MKAKMPAYYVTLSREIRGAPIDKRARIIASLNNFVMGEWIALFEASASLLDPKPRRRAKPKAKRGVRR